MGQQRQQYYSKVVASLDAAVIAAVIVVASLVSLGQSTGDTVDILGGDH